MVKDPICGMQIDENKAIKITHDGRDYFFCSTHCKDKFIKRPLFKNRLFIISSIPVILIFASFFLPFLIPFRKSFLMYLKLIWGTIALGLFLGGIIDYYIPGNIYLKSFLTRGPRQYSMRYF